MNIVKRFAFIFIIVFFFSNCKKEKRGLSWDSDYSLPIATTTITLKNFIADSLLENSGNKVGIVYKTTLYELDKSLLFNIPDTTILYPYSGIPFGTINVFPSQVITETVQEIQLPTGQAGISRMIMQSGKLQYTLTNRITQPLVIVYSIPAATKNNQSLSVSINVPAATSNLQPTVVVDSIDLAGYDIDMTGTAQNSVNKVSSLTTISLAPNAQQTVLDNTTTFNFSITFQKLKPYYARGYFGQSIINVGPSYSNLDVFKNMKSGSFNLSKASCALDIENGIGVDAKLKIKSINSSNTKSNKIQNLTHPLINKYLNINRALDNPYQLSNYQIYLDETNSNIKNLIEIMPNKIGYEMQVEMNPLGNISNGTDFIYSDKLMSAKMLLRIPLNTKLNELVLQDTISLNLDDKFANEVNYGRLKLYLKNYFKNDVKLNLFTLNSDNTIGTDISSNNFVTPNLNGSNEKKTIEIVMPTNIIKDLFATKKLLIKVTLNSNENYVEINSDSRIEVQASADFTRTNYIK